MLCVQTWTLYLIKRNIAGGGSEWEPCPGLAVALPCPLHSPLFILPHLSTSFGLSLSLFWNQQGEGGLKPSLEFYLTGHIFTRAELLESQGPVGSV